MWEPKFVKDGLSFTSSGIFTHILNNNYAAPCKLDVYQMDQKREVVEQKFQSRNWEIIGDKFGFAECLLNYANQFKTNHVLISAGMDFSYQFADLSYKFLEDSFKIIGTEEIRAKMKFKYSTVDEYYKAI